MPVYQGSIVRIEPHSDDCHISDLIIRVPNFQCLPSPLSDNDNSSSRPSSRMKRRAPICPLLYGPTPNLSTTNTTQPVTTLNLSQSEEINTKRITTGLRSLSRAFTQSCKPKRTASFNEQNRKSSLLNEKIRNSIKNKSHHHRHHRPFQIKHKQIINIVKFNGHQDQQFSQHNMQKLKEIIRRK